MVCSHDTLVTKLFVKKSPPESRNLLAIVERFLQVDLFPSPVFRFCAISMGQDGNPALDIASGGQGHVKVKTLTQSQQLLSWVLLDHQGNQQIFFNCDHFDKLDVISTWDDENLGCNTTAGQTLRLTDVCSLDAFMASMDLNPAHSFIGIFLQTIRRRLYVSCSQHSWLPLEIPDQWLRSQAVDIKSDPGPGSAAQ